MAKCDKSLKSSCAFCMFGNPLRRDEKNRMHCSNVESAFYNSSAETRLPVDLVGGERVGTNGFYVQDFSSCSFHSPDLVRWEKFQDRLNVEASNARFEKRLAHAFGGVAL